MKMTLPDNKVVERVLVGFIKTERELEAVIKEITQQFHVNNQKKKTPLLVELWSYTKPCYRNPIVPNEQSEKSVQS